MDLIAQGISLRLMDMNGQIGNLVIEMCILLLMIPQLNYVRLFSRVNGLVVPHHPKQLCRMLQIQQKNLRLL